MLNQKLYDSISALSHISNSPQPKKIDSKCIAKKYLHI